MPWIWPGQVGYIGPNLGVGLHAASVAVLWVGLDAPFTLEIAGYGVITVCSAYVPARTTHRVVAPEGRILLLFIDPAGVPAVHVAVAMQRQGRALWPRSPAGGRPDRRVRTCQRP